MGIRENDEKRMRREEDEKRMREEEVGDVAYVKEKEIEE